MMLEHQPRRLQNSCIRIDRDHVAGHHVFGFMGQPPIVVVTQAKTAILTLIQVNIGFTGA